MKKKLIINTIAAAALVLAACDAHDPTADTPQQVQAVITATIGDVTRMGTSQPHVVTRSTNPDTGYDGVVKKAFIEGDTIGVNYYIDTGFRHVTATRNAAGEWTTPTSFYIDLGNINPIEAYYGQVTNTNEGITTYGDILQATGTLAPPTTDGDPYTVSFSFEHRNALLQTITYINERPATQADITSVIIHLNNREKVAPDANGFCIVPSDVTITSVEITLADATAITAIPPTITLVEGETYTLGIYIGEGHNNVTLNLEQNEIPAWNDPVNMRIENTATTHYIYDVDGLVNFRDAVNAGSTTLNAVQMANITLTGNWTPIGTSTQKYTGTYNGSAYTITGMEITGDHSFAGFFGYVSNATLANIHLVDVNVTSTNNRAIMGALVGQTYSSTIALCSSTGTVSKGVRTGGLIGVADNSHITRCTSTCTVIQSAGSSLHLGGLVGYVNRGYIIACMANGEVKAMSEDGYSGGLAGSLSTSNTCFCYATAQVTGAGISGGFVGVNNSSSVQRSYTTQPTFANNTDADANNWNTGKAGTPGIIVRNGSVAGVRTWVNNRVETITFDSTIWTDDDFPTLKFNMK